MGQARGSRGERLSTVGARERAKRGCGKVHRRSSKGRNQRRDGDRNGDRDRSRGELNGRPIIISKLAYGGRIFPNEGRPGMGGDSPNALPRGQTDPRGGEGGQLTGKTRPKSV